jgi:hypothetical protein
MSFGAGNFKEGTEKEKERAGKESVKEAGKWELGPREGEVNRGAAEWKNTTLSSRNMPTHCLESAAGGRSVAL